MKRLWIVAIVVMFAVVGGLVYSAVHKISSAAVRSVSFNTSGPIKFTPEPIFYCNAIKQHGGLQEEIIAAEQHQIDLVWLRMIVASSPVSDQKAMSQLYFEVLHHLPITVQGGTSCIS